MKRRDDFKNYELNKAAKYKSKFRDLKPEEQQRKLKEHLEKAKNHPRLSHPVSSTVEIDHPVVMSAQGGMTYIDRGQLKNWNVEILEIFYTGNIHPV